MSVKRNEMSTTAQQRDDKTARSMGAPERDTDAALTDQAPATLETAVNTALDSENFRDARTLVANAEAILAGHLSLETDSAKPLTRTQIAAAKARIAIASGDRAAARAILVQAIEADPATSTLKSMMTEVMLVEGRASDVRPVLQHLGNRLPQSRKPLPAGEHSTPLLRDTTSG